MVHRSCVDAVRSLPLLATEFAMSRPYLSSSIMIFLVVLLGQSPAKADEPKRLVDIGGTVPLDAPDARSTWASRQAPWPIGRPRGCLRGQPIKGDAVTGAAGTCTAGTTASSGSAASSVGGDRPKGTLTSVPFRVTQPFASFLVGGGSLAGTRVELVRPDIGPGGLPRLRR